MIYVEAPNDAPTGAKMPSIFLAGSIQGTSDWQSEMVKYLKDLDMIIYNPRRKNFPMDDPNAAEGQITWEFKKLRLSSMISFWFSKETLAPIVLFEYGQHTMTSKPLVTGVDPKYPRRQDVEIQTKLIRPEIKIVYDLKELSDQIAKKYNTEFPYLL